MYIMWHCGRTGRTSIDRLRKVNTTMERRQLSWWNGRLGLIYRFDLFLSILLHEFKERNLYSYLNQSFRRPFSLSILSSKPETQCVKAKLWRRPVLSSNPVKPITTLFSVCFGSPAIEPASAKCKRRRFAIYASISNV